MAALTQMKCWLLFFAAVSCGPTFHKRSSETLLLPELLARMCRALYSWLATLVTSPLRATKPPASVSRSSDG